MAARLGLFLWTAALLPGALTACSGTPSEPSDPASQNGAGTSNAGGEGSGGGADSVGSAGTSSAGGTPAGEAGAVGVGGASAGGATSMAGAGGSIAQAGTAGAGGSTVEMPLPPGNRCELAGVTVGQGTTTLIDDIEDGNVTILPADGRDDSDWFESHDTSVGAMATLAIEPTTDGAPGSTQALHYVASGLDGWGAVVGVPLALCYDASAYEGLSFWIKGTPNANATQIKVSVHTPISEPMASGGACEPEIDCYNHFTVPLFDLPPQWTRYTLTWGQLAQGVGWGIQAPAGYRPEQQILTISFSPVYGDMPAAIMDKSIDFWIDELSFDVTGDLAGGFPVHVTEGVFDSMFTVGRNALYNNAYQDIVTALMDPRFSRFAREGTVDDQKREIAAFLANVGHESGDLAYAEEIPTNCASANCEYCDPAVAAYPCSAGQKYFGRGPMQLTWNGNYGTVSEFLGFGKDALLSNPGRVATEGPLAWKAGLWYWMEPSHAHTRFLAEGFGATIDAVNGALECNGQNPATVNSRLTRYRAFCDALGVAYAGTDTGC